MHVYNTTRVTTLNRYRMLLRTARFALLQPPPGFDAGQGGVRLSKQTDDDARYVREAPGMNNGWPVGPADDHYGRVLAGFDQLNG